MSVDDSHKQPAVQGGDLASVCEKSGYKQEKSLEQWVIDNRQKLIDIFADDICSEVEIICTPTSFCNPYMLENLGLAEKCSQINRELLCIATEAAKKAENANIKIAGTVGASGVYTEPFGEVSFTELISAYDKQVKALEDGVDVFILDGLNAVWDMRAALLSCKKTDKPVFVIAETDEDGLTSQHRVPAKAALIMLQEMGADGFGICCENTADCVHIIKELLPYANIPLIAKIKCVLPDDKENLIALLGAGIQIIGTAEQTTRILSDIGTHTAVSKTNREKEDTSFIFTHNEQIYFLEPDTTEISEPIQCLPDMEETISETCRESVDILLVQINTADDAFDFAANAHMATIPVMFTSHNEIALKMALMLYQGRALIDRNTSISEEALAEMTEKYGAVVY